MKKNLAIIILLLSVITSASAQKNEISVHYGIGTSNVIIEEFGDIITEAFTFGLYSVDNENSWGCIGIEYQSDVGDKFQLGIAAAYQTLNKDLLNASDKSKSGHVKDTYFSVMPRARIFYIKKPGFRLYSGLSAGLTFRTETATPEGTSSWSETSTSKTNFAFQADVAGIQFGKSFFGSVAAGFGVKGLLNGGIGYRF